MKILTDISVHSFSWNLGEQQWMDVYPVYILKLESESELIMLRKQEVNTKSLTGLMDWLK